MAHLGRTGNGPRATRAGGCARGGMGACTGPLSLTHTRTHLCTQSYTYIDIHTYGNTLINTHLCTQPYTYIQPCIQNTHAHRCTHMYSTHTQYTRMHEHASHRSASDFDPWRRALQGRRASGKGAWHSKQGGGDVGRGRGQPSGRRRRWIGDSRVIAACVGVFPVDYFLVSVNFSYFYSIFFS